MNLCNFSVCDCSWPCVHILSRHTLLRVVTTVHGLNSTARTHFYSSPLLQWQALPQYLHCHTIPTAQSDLGYRNKFACFGGYARMLSTIDGGSSSPILLTHDVRLTDRHWHPSAGCKCCVKEAQCARGLPKIYVYRCNAKLKICSMWIYMAKIGSAHLELSQNGDFHLHWH